MDHYFTIYQYKTEESKNIGISASISFRGLNVLVWNRHVFHKSKMTAFQTYKYGIKNVVIWVEILQLCRYTMAVIIDFIWTQEWGFPKDKRK